MKRKVTIEAGNYGYWQIEDVTEFYNEKCLDLGKDDADKYFAPVIWVNGESDNNGYAYCFLEGLGQSDDCPPFLWNASELTITVEDVK